MLKNLGLKDYDTVLYFITAVSTLWLAIIAQISSQSWIKQNNFLKKFDLANALLSTITNFEKIYLKYIKDLVETNDSLIIAEFDKITQDLQTLIYDYKIIQPNVVPAIEYFLNIIINYYYIDFYDIGEGQMAPEQCYIWDKWQKSEDPEVEKNNQKNRIELETHIQEIKNICKKDIKIYYGIK